MFSISLYIHSLRAIKQDYQKPYALAVTSRYDHCDSRKKCLGRLLAPHFHYHTFLFKFQAFNSSLYHNFVHYLNKTHCLIHHFLGSSYDNIQSSRM